MYYFCYWSSFCMTLTRGSVAAVFNQSQFPLLKLARTENGWTAGLWDGTDDQSCTRPNWTKLQPKEWNSTLTSLADWISFSMVFTFSGREKGPCVSLLCKTHHWMESVNGPVMLGPGGGFNGVLWRWGGSPWALIRTISSLRESTFSSSCLFFCSRFCIDSVSDLIFASSWTITTDTDVWWEHTPVSAAVSASGRAIKHSGHGYLGDAELAGCQLGLHLVHLLAAVAHGALQLLAAFHHRLHLWLHLADVKTSHRELFIDQAAALLLL